MLMNKFLPTHIQQKIGRPLLAYITILFCFDKLTQIYLVLSLFLAVLGLRKKSLRNADEVETSLNCYNDFQENSQSDTSSNFSKYVIVIIYLRKNSYFKR